MTFRMKPTTLTVSLIPALLILSAQTGTAGDVTFAIIDTMQDACYDNVGDEITCPAEGEVLYGQDTQHPRLAASYTSNGDGTVLDNNTGLLWQKTPENARLQYAEALTYCSALELGERGDWRVPSIKELYSLADFRGELLKPEEGEPTPYIDTTVFDFFYPDESMIFA